MNLAKSRSTWKTFLVLPLASLGLLVVAQLSSYGFFIEIGWTSFRTLLFPAIEVTIAIFLFCVFVGRAYKHYMAGTKFVLIWLLSITLVCAATLIGIETYHANFVRKVESQITSAIANGQSSNINEVKFRAPLTSAALLDVTCANPEKQFANWFTATFYLRCGDKNIEADVVYLWSTAWLSIRTG